MRTRDDISLDVVRQFELFDGFDAGELEEVADLVEYRIYDPGERVLEQGDESRDVYVLADGTVEVIKEVGDTERLLATLEPEAVLGELGLVLGEPRSATVVADGEAHLLRVAGDPLVERRDAGELGPYKFEHNVLVSLARRQANMNRQLMEAMENRQESKFHRDEVSDLREQLADNWSF